MLVLGRKKKRGFHFKNQIEENLKSTLKSKHEERRSNHLRTYQDYHKLLKVQY